MPDIPPVVVSEDNEDLAAELRYDRLCLGILRPLPEEVLGLEVAAGEGGGL